MIRYTITNKFVISSFVCFEIIREKLGRPIVSWKRFSDGCDGRFRSRYTVTDFMKACARFDLKQASFDYFEANEGKNVSDTIGSIVKCAYVRGKRHCICNKFGTENKNKEVCIFYR